MTDIRRYTSRKRTWRAWAGTEDELSRISTIVDDLHRRLPSSSLPETDFERTYVEVVIRNGFESASGSFEQVIAELDRRTVSEVAFKIVARYSVGNPLILRFRFEGHEAAAELKTGHTDVGWVNQAASTLSEEVDKGQPWWSFVHRESVRIVLLVGTLMAVAFTSGRLYRLFIPEPWWYLANNVTGFLTVAPFLFSHPAWLWLFPKAEILVSGASSTGGRRLAALGALVLTVVLGVFVNTIPTP